MDIQLSSALAELGPVLGRWRTSGQVLDTSGAVTATIAGSDTYTVLPGGSWIAHEVDIDMGDGQRTLVHELIGGRHDQGGWQMYAFDESDQPGVMRLTHEEPGLLLLHGAGVRSWLRLAAGPRHMTTRWERHDAGRWIPWMDMRFDRADSSVPGGD